MDQMERDPEHIAQVVKQLRQHHGITQEALAALAGLTTRTIEKVESGKHRPEEQTLRGIARAVGVEVSVFKKLSPEEHAAFNASLQRAMRTTLLVPTRPVLNLLDFSQAFEGFHGLQTDLSSIASSEALEIAATIIDFARDMIDVWDDVPASSHLEWAPDFLEQCAALKAAGHLCHMGRYRAVDRSLFGRPMLMRVGLVSIRPEENADGERYALVTLPDHMETHPDDRPLLPND